ncbi:class I SAM-dependent methyltransferase [Mycolicibacterium sphagni]|jgi:methyltransferase (TIGR00027 family)|uniref:class I SAM-dependent methyltransferase n=1 Tax=Mycolicibacterium sphagni TaxID=1786 RepID=UPI001F44B069|nr:class I SAM-dependent methyltransferase [Mycolicibacterium sphagni]
MPATGRVVVRTALKSATDRKIGGGWASFLCRKRYIDDQLRAAVAKGVDAVVILGAGYDTRAFRLPELAGFPVCEVDLPGNTTRRAAALHRTFGRDRYLRPAGRGTAISEIERAVYAERNS